MFQAKRAPYKRIAVVISLCVLILWGVLGTGTSLAWFTDTTPEICNIFHIADFELAVSRQLADGTWEAIDGQTKVFDEAALYEPGYTQVVALKVENKGDRAFRVDTAVTVTDFTLATNVFGERFNLQDYLRFGLVTADNEQELNSRIADRDAAKAVATSPLNRYYATETAEVLGAGESSYIALIVHMPETVDNVANYRGDTVPTVELGVIVTADQAEH